MPQDENRQYDGARFYPAAFLRQSFELGKTVASDDGFNQIFNRFVLAVVADPSQLIHFRAVLVQDVARVCPHNLPMVSQITWCALSLCTDKYFDDSARILGWTEEEMNGLKSKWYEFTAIAFVPSANPNKLGTSALKDWSFDFLTLHKFNRGVSLSQRDQVIMALVKQALAGAPWQTINAEVMSKLNITEAEVEAELERLKKSAT